MDSALLIEKISVPARSPSLFCPEATPSGLSSLSLALNIYFLSLPYKIPVLGGSEFLLWQGSGKRL